MNLKHSFLVFLSLIYRILIRIPFVLSLSKDSNGKTDVRMVRQAHHERALKLCVISRNLLWTISLCLMVLLPGCSCRIVDWAQDAFYQGRDLNDFRTVPQQFLRYITVYDQFETLGMFDAIWLAPSVRAAYSRLYSCKRGKSMDHEKAFLRRQLEENNYFIDFYVLSLYDRPLDTDDSAWTLFLEIDCERYTPTEIKAIDLEPEYKFFFGKRMSKFKVPYRVRFNANDLDNVPLIDGNTQSVSLVLRSVEKEVMLTWCLPQLQCFDTIDLESPCCLKTCA